MDRHRQLDSIAADVATIATLTAAEPGAPVPACPDWRRADLRAHVSGFARLVTRLLDGRAGRDTPHIAVPVDEAAVTFDADTAALVDALTAAEDDTPVPNWSVRPEIAAFWMRRAVHELAVHRVDAGATEPVPLDVALDGILEYFDTFVATAVAAGSAPPARATLVLQLTDAGTQRYDLPEPGPETVLRGPASELVLALWHRRDLMSFHAGGSTAPLEAWPHV